MTFILGATLYKSLGRKATCLIVSELTMPGSRVTYFKAGIGEKPGALSIYSGSINTRSSSDGQFLQNSNARSLEFKLAYKYFKLGKFCNPEILFGPMCTSDVASLEMTMTLPVNLSESILILSRLSILE